jgi:3-phosphoshikimate 1-carboxyvinyltransferase
LKKKMAPNIGSSIENAQTHSMTLHRVKSLSEVHLPDCAIVIADAQLPQAILTGLNDAPVLTVTAGESLKSLAAIEELATRVLAIRATRPLLLVGLGGGSIGDAVGFLASILWRGVDLWHIPTTLLAMVDSAHGGKTAINLGQAKNQLGTFHTPQRVYLVEEILDSLPLSLRREGLAEIVKALWLADPKGVRLLDANGGIEALASDPMPLVRQRLWELIDRAIAVKLQIVSEDPRETAGRRTILNLGHTLAHALELDEGLPHGDAVAWGLASVPMLSHDRGLLEASTAEKLRRQIYPLLTHIKQPQAHSTSLEHLIARDKKRQHGALRSVLLEDVGSPVVTDEIDAGQWITALSETYHGWQGSPVSIHLARARQCTPLIPASKSVLNRLLTIAYLRPGPTTILGTSRADDVLTLQAALQHFRCAGDAPCIIHCHEGGTTLRFMLAIAATRAARTTLLVTQGLFKRPHAPLIEALRKAGARVESFCDGIQYGFHVTGWPNPPEFFRIDGMDSSQYASALAMLAATGFPVTLELTPDRESMVSAPYFDMTLALLERAGVEVCWTSPDRVHLSPSPSLTTPWAMEAPSDASAIALWHALHHLCPDLSMELPSLDPAQPDCAMPSILERFNATPSHATLEFDMSPHPDLTPVVCAVALLSPQAVRLKGAAHLRLKESNRIEDFASSLDSIGLRVQPTPDGLTIPAGVQKPRELATFDPRGDHRLAMAALTLTSTGTRLHLQTPLVVAKSYPELWMDARKAGWRITPL